LIWVIFADVKTKIRNTTNTILYLLVWVKQNISKRQFLLLASVIVGIFASIGVVLIKAIAHWVFMFATYINGILKLPYTNSVLPIIGILLTVFVVQRFFGGRVERGLSQIMYAVAKKKSILSQKKVFSQIITNSLTVGFGGSAGIETPSAITGASFGSNFAQYFKLSYKERTLLLACGVAAATSAAFNAPIAGVLFSIEVILADVSITAFIPIMIASATGAIVSGILLNENILMYFYQKQVFEFNDIWFYIVLGLITGLVSVYYSRIFQYVSNYFNALEFGVYKKAIFGSSLLALLLFIVPTLFGQGYESIKILLSDNPNRLLEDTIFSDFLDNSWLLLFFVGLGSFLKVFAVSLSLNSGGNGGNFGPSLFVGSYIGFLFSYLINLTGLVRIPITSFTLVGMAGVFSGLLHAPLTAIFLIGEISSGYSLMVPLLIVSSISFAVSKKYETYSIDIKKLAKKGDVFTNNKDRNILSSISLNDILITHYQTLLPNENLEKLYQIVSKSNQRNFAVVDTDNKIVGILDFDRVRNIIFDNFKRKYSSIGQIMKPIDTIIYYENSIYIMLEKLEQSGEDFLPIVRNKKYYGFVSKIKILEHYRNQLKSMRVE